MLGVSRSTGRTGVAEEVGVAVVVTDEEIEIAVAIDIGKSGAGVAANIGDPKGITGWSLLSDSCGEIGSCREVALAASGPLGVDHQSRIGSKRTDCSWSSKREDGIIACTILDGAAVEGEC